MKFLLPILVLSLVISCITTNNKIDNDNGNETPRTGWSNPDTYIVEVTGKNEDQAILKARHKILRDIVNIRMFNRSRYTDITKIRTEFEEPLKKGLVIKRFRKPEGIKIFFQIREKGLKKKFERK